MRVRFATHLKFRLAVNKFRGRSTRREYRNLLLMAALLAGVLISAAFASAETLSGTVTNGTTGKPAAGDDVVLLTLSQGMNESGRTKTDAKGHFSFNLEDAGVPHLVRVNHQGVNYFPAGGPIMPGAATTAIQVYDAAKRVDGIVENVHLMRMQADGGTLQVIELISLNNRSTPPRTLMADRTWQIYLPEGAQIDQGIAQSPGGMPVNNAPVPDDAQKGRYYYVFPIRPGETRFQVSYHLPYSGEATLKPRVTGKLEHFGVLLPKSMEFSPAAAGIFSPVPDQSNQSTLEVATGVTPDKDLSFRIKRTGALPAENEAAGGQQSQAQPGGNMPGRGPGGGLGNPEGTPDPLHQYRFAILGACVAMLALGGFWVVTHSRASGNGAASTAPVRAGVAAPVAASSRQKEEPPSPNLLLEALKEELFQLELERQQGRISDADYATAKAALDKTLQRALARSQATRA